MSRAYHSPLRTRQVEQTRELLLETVLAMASDEEPAEISIASVAARAGVAVRTAYRYFATKEELIEAFNAWAHKRAGFPEISFNPDELPGAVERLFVAYEQSGSLLRAARRMSPEIKKARRADQARKFARALSATTARLDPQSARAALASLHVLSSSDTFFHMTETWGIGGAEAGRAARWAMETLLKEIAAGRGPRFDDDGTQAPR